MELAGKRIVIIGGSSGIGLATAREAARRGADVVIAGRSRQKLEAARKEIEGSLLALSLDVTDESSVKTFFEAAGEFDHLATPGSEAVIGKFPDVDIRRAREAFDSKFWGQYHAVYYGHRHIRAGGSIVLFSGVYSQRPDPGGSILAAINSGIEGLTRALAIELAPLRVNAVSPGLVDTPMWEKFMTEDERREVFAAVAGRIPARRVAKPEDIAETVLYLMSHPHTTGSTLFVDGGVALR